MADAGNPTPADAGGDPQGAPEFSGDWRGLIPAELRAEKTWEKFKEPGAFFKSYHEQDKAMGRMVRIPGADAKPEEVAAFREKLGVPKDTTGYAAPKLEGLDAERWGRWAGLAHKHGLTPGQLEAFAHAEAEERQHAAARTRESYREAHDQLKTEWGEARYNKEVTLAHRAIKAAADEAGLDWGKDVAPLLDQTGLGDHPMLVRLWAAAGATLAEHGIVEGRVEGVPTADEAAAKIAAIRADKAHPFNNPGHPEHMQAVEAMNKLYLLRPGGADVAFTTASAATRRR